MADDHFVAQTYLKHFAGPNGLLRVYRKSDGKTFPCRPKDICHEPNGDVIPDFLTVPDYLGKYRSAFEPGWNGAIEALKARAPDAATKYYIAGYWSQLMVCTPSWKRVAVEISNQNAINTVRAHNVLAAKIGKPDDKVREAIEAVDRGEIKVETEGDFVRAQAAESVIKYAWALYNADWRVFESDGVDFITSDNPAAFKDQGDTWGRGRLPFIRFLPITPRLCLMCDLTAMPDELRTSKPDFEKHPQGAIEGGLAASNTIESINVCVAKCAEDLIICGDESGYVRDLAAKYSRFRVQTQSASFQTPRGIVVSNRTRAIEMADAAAS